MPESNTGVRWHKQQQQPFYGHRPDGNWTTRGYANSRIANSRTGHLADWSTRALVNSRTGQVTDWTTRGLADDAKKEN